MSTAEYAVQVILASPVTEVHAFCDSCHWRRLEESDGAYQHFVNEAKAHCHHTGHTAHITRTTATTSTVTRRTITNPEEEFRDPQGPTHPH
jgi:hypothetical protein